MSLEIQAAHKSKQLLCKEVFGEFFQTSLSLHHCTRSIQRWGNYHCKPQIAMTGFIPQAHARTNSVYSAAVILFQTIIYILGLQIKATTEQENKSRTTMANIILSTLHQNNSQFNCPLAKKCCLLDPQTADSPPSTMPHFV